jgi:hypothetical protein
MTGHKSKVIGQEDSAEVSGDSEKFKIRNKRKGHKRGWKSGIRKASSDLTVDFSSVSSLLLSKLSSKTVILDFIHMPIPPLHELILRHLPTHDRFLLRLAGRSLDLRKVSTNPKISASLLTKCLLNTKRRSYVWTAEKYNRFAGSGIWSSNNGWLQWSMSAKMLIFQ